MGMPFPTGLKLVETVEWAWALNAAASVLGSVMAMVIAIHFGLTITLACAAIAYLLAAAFADLATVEPGLKPATETRRTCCFTSRAKRGIPTVLFDLELERGNVLNHTALGAKSELRSDEVPQNKHWR